MPRGPSDPAGRLDAGDQLRRAEALHKGQEDHPGAGESEGWLLLLVHSAETDRSALHILNAEDMTGEAQAVVELPQRVPAGFHGNWVPDHV